MKKYVRTGEYSKALALIKSLPLEELQKRVDSCTLYTDLTREFSVSTTYHKLLREYLRKKGVDFRGLKERSKAKRSEIQKLAKLNMGCSSFAIAESQIPLLLVENCQLNIHKARAKIRLLNKKYQWLEEVCQGCGNVGIWQDKVMSLDLDHINGINNDNRLENLRFLCPNCHRITDTFGGKSNKKLV